MIAPAGFTNTRNVGGLPLPQLDHSGSAASVAAPGTTLPTGTPIQQLSDLSRKLELDTAGHVGATEGNLALLGQIGELSHDPKFQKMVWQLRQQLQRGEKVPHGESHARLSKALTEASGAASAFQSPGPASAEGGATARKKALADALHQLTLQAGDARFSCLQASVRDAIALLPKDFFTQCHEVVQAGGPLASCYLRAMNGGHVFQTNQDFNLHIRTPLFFPADRSRPLPQNLNLADRKRLMVLAFRMNTALSMSQP